MEKKILFLLPSPPPYAGPEIMAESLKQYVIKNNITDVHFLNSNIRKNNRDKGHFNIEGIAATAILLLRFLLSLFRSRKVYFYLSSSKVGFFKDSLFILVARLFRKEIFPHYHGGIFKNFYLKQGHWYQKYIKFVLNRSTTIITLGEMLKNQFQSITKSQIDYVYNGIQIPENKVSNSNRDNEKVRILFLGHLTYPKGFYNLITVYKKILKDFSNIDLHFAGEYVEKSAKQQLSEFLSGTECEYYLNNSDMIHDEIKEFMVNDKLNYSKYLGVVSGREKEMAFLNSDIFVLPSFTEGLPMSILEAMSYGLPVITTDTGVNREILPEGQKEYIIDFGDLDHFESLLKKLIRSKSLREEIGDDNRTHIEKFFGVNKTYEKIMSILN